MSKRDQILEILHRNYGLKGQLEKSADEINKLIDQFAEQIVRECAEIADEEVSAPMVYGDPDPQMAILRKFKVDARRKSDSLTKLYL